MEMVHTIDDIRRKPALLVQCGGKGKNLFRLQQFGFNVPELVVLPYESLKSLFHFDDTPVRACLQQLTNENSLKTSQEINQLLKNLQADSQKHVLVGK